MTERRAVYNASPLEDEFALQLQIAGIPFEREYRAVKGRKISIVERRAVCE